MAKRINKPFLIVLSLIVVGGGLAAMLLAAYLMRPNPAKLIADGDRCVEAARRLGAAQTASASTPRTPEELATAAAEEQAQWESARRLYTLGLKGGSTAELRVKLGDVAHELVRFNPREQHMDTREWDRALEIKPGYVPALQRLLDETIAIAQFMGGGDHGENFEDIARRARSLSESDPSDRRARAWRQIALIESWLKSPGSPDKLEAAIAELEKMIIERPAPVPPTPEGEYRPQPLDEALLSLTIEKACRRMGANREAIGDDAKAMQWLERARRAYEIALQAQPDNAGIWLRYHQFQSRAGASAWRVGWLRELLIEHALRMAIATVRADDPHYAEVCMEAATAAQDRGDAAETEAQLSRLALDRADDMDVRLQVAEQYRDMRDVDAAIELMEKPVPVNTGIKGTLAVKYRENDWRRRVLLAELLLDKYEAPPAGQRPAAEAQAKLESRIRSEFEQLVAVWPAADSHPAVQSLRARVLLTLERGDKPLLEAIRLMRLAYDQASTRNYVDRRMTLRLVQALLQVNQTGEAKRYLTNLVKAYSSPNLVLQLAQMLLTMEGQTDQADVYISQVARLLDAEGIPADDPSIQALREQVVSLRLVQLSMQGRPKAEILKAIQDLREETAPQKLAKARQFLAQGGMDEALALLQPLAERELSAGPTTNPTGPARLPACQVLVQAYQVSPDGKTKAHELAARVANAYPDDYDWKLAELRTRPQPDPKEIEAAVQARIDHISDPVQKNLEEQVHQLMLGDSAKAAAALTAAETEIEKRVADLRQKNSDAVKLAQAEALWREALERRFQEAVGRSDWEAARKCTEKLGELDPQPSGPLYQAVRLDLARKQYQPALEAARSLVSRAGDLGRSWLTLAIAQEGLRQWDQALRSYAQVLDRDLLNESALQGMVRCNDELGRRDEALRVIDRALRTLSQTDWFQARRLELLESTTAPVVTGERERAWRDNPTPQTMLALYRNYAIVLEQAQSGNDQAMRTEYLKRARALLAEGLVKWPDELALYAYQVNLALWGGNVDEAIAAIDQLATREQWKQSPEPHLMRAQAHQVRARRDPATAETSMKAAEAELNAAVAAAGAAANKADLPRCRLQLAQFYLTSNRLDQATAIYAELFDETRDADIGDQLASIYLGQGKKDKAEELGQKALKSASDNPDMGCLLARVQFSLGKTAEGLGQLEAVLKAKPGYWRALFYRGDYRLGTGDLAGALADMEQAQRNVPGVVPLLWQRLASIYSSMRRPDDAVKMLDSLLAAAPQSVEARVGLVRLYGDQQRWQEVDRLLAEAKADPMLSQNPRWWTLEARSWDARRNSQRKHQAIKTAHDKAPTDPEVESMYLESLLDQKKYDEVLDLTASVEGAATAPWWRYEARGAALAKTRKVPEGQKMFESAMAAVDSSLNDLAVESITRGALSCFETKWVEDNLLARKASRWALQLASVYHEQAVVHNTPDDWENACRAADELLRRAQNQPTSFASEAQRLAAVDRAGQIYTGAAISLSDPRARDDARRKAIAIYQTYIKDVKQSGDVLAQLYALNNLAAFLLERPGAEDKANALAYAKEGYELMQREKYDVPEVSDTYGEVLTAVGQLDKAVEVLRAAVSRPQPLVESYLKLAEALLAKGQLDPAAAAVQDFLDRAGRAKQDPRMEPLLRRADEVLRKIDTARGGK